MKTKNDIHELMNGMDSLLEKVEKNKTYRNIEFNSKKLREYKKIYKIIVREYNNLFKQYSLKDTNEELMSKSKTLNLIK